MSEQVKEVRTHSYVAVGKHCAAYSENGVWHVAARRSGDVLGTVEMNPNWRQMVFVPLPDSEFSADCMEAIARFLRKL